MNHPDPDLLPTADLELLGATLRTEATHHRGDLPSLLHRAQLRRVRSRAIMGIVVVLGLAAAGTLRTTGGHTAVQSGGHTPAAPTADKPADSPTSTQFNTRTQSSTTTPSSINVPPKRPSTSMATSTTTSYAPPPPLPTATFGDWTGIKPSTIYFSGDSGNIVSDINWSSWNARSATGSGTWGYNPCVPSCAEGPVTHYPATVVLTEPANGRFGLVTEYQSGPFGKTYTHRLPDPALLARP